MGGRGIATAGALILIALICISISRKIETERRELGRFPRERLPLVIGALIAEAISSTGAASIKDMGKVMGVVKAKAAGKADMGAVGARIKAKLGS